MKIPETTLQEQYASSNPQNSAWVSANAGSGKTHVLTQRVIRLMLEGNPPDKILCLTFTKAAAANMKNRVFKTLSNWTMMEDAALDKEIENTNNTAVTASLRNRARQLFALALDTPGGLKIQTIHAFCVSLLHQFPLEANVPGHFEEIQEIEQANMLAEARARALNSADSEATKHYEALIPHATDSAIEKALHAIIKMRQDFLNWTKGDVELALEPLYEKLRVTKNTTPEKIKQDAILDILTDGKRISNICALAATSNKQTDTKLAAALQMLIETKNIEQAFEAVRSAVLTKTNSPKSEKKIATKFVKDDIPDTIEVLFEIADKIMIALENMAALQLLYNSFHLFKIGEIILNLYDTMKHQRGLIDYDDQIDKCATLLARSEIKDWIRYRLDKGIDHMLVDEAQDTSPKQWEIINAITDDFYSGETASNSKRTIFVVGDEKQSIYSFQGAEPSEFDRQRKNLKKRAGNQFNAGSLDLSFRSTQDVLRAVDEVFNVPENLKGLTQSGEKPIHDAVRQQDPGEVQIWPLYVKQTNETTKSWSDPIDKLTAEDPAVLLAKHISQSIEKCVGTTLPGMERPLKFADIMVLVRKRDPRFLTAFTRNMKDKGLAIAGADRLTLTNHIAVEDLVALGRVALLPQDDLSLASVLKGVFFNLDDDMLFELAHGREALSLYEQIIKISADETHSKCAIATQIVEQLQVIFRVGQRASVFDFYAYLLGKLGGRKKILARLGLEAEDILDAFLDEALAFTNDRNGGLETFITELTDAEPEIKRELELERDEVQVITVHSSKGLEARVVFLVDHCGTAWTEKHRPEILEVKNEPYTDGYLWLGSKEQHVTLTRESTALIEEAAEAEYRRLLYVGMTRAADRLIVCGYSTKEDHKHPYWHKMVGDGLADTSSEIKNEQGETVALKWVLEDRPAITAKNNNPEHTQSIATTTPPEWLFKPAKSDPPLPRPLTPSGAYALIDRDSLTRETLKFNNQPEVNSIAIQKGNATHKLFEVLPDILPENRLSLAQDYINKTCPALTKQQQADILKSVFNVFDDERFKHLFEGEAQAEVSLAGRLDIKSASMLVTGQIDRLIVSKESVTILDYKTNRQVPKTPNDAPDEYIAQLALYRELVSRIYKSKQVISALLWTQTPELMVIPDETLDMALQAIKNR